jgi:hypothetical protein
MVLTKSLTEHYPHVFFSLFLGTIICIVIEKIVYKMTWKEIVYTRSIIILFVITYCLFSPIIENELLNSFTITEKKITVMVKIIYALWISLVAYTIKNLLEVTPMTKLSLKVLISSSILIIGECIFGP